MNWSFVLRDSFIYAHFERVIARADVVERAQRSHVVPFCVHSPSLIYRTSLCDGPCLWESPLLVRDGEGMFVVPHDNGTEHCDDIANPRTYNIVQWEEMTNTWEEKSQ